MSSPHRTSDTEGHEKPVREKLRNASISATALGAGQAHNDQLDSSTHDTQTDASDAPAVGNGELRGRVSRKRSHEDVAEEAQLEPATKSRHARKRSRDTDQDEEDNVSPKRRSSEEQPRDSSSTNGAQTQHTLPKRHVSTNKRPATPADEDEASAAGEHVASPKMKKSKPDESALPVLQDREEGENKQENNDKASSIPPTSGFANASAASPFSALAGAKSPTAPTSTSAFKSSGFGALASSSTSGFGSLAGSASKLSSFASAPSAPPTASSQPGKSDDDKSAPKTFGGALGLSTPFAAAAPGAASAFASPASAFSQTGKSTFGSGLGGGFGAFGGSKLGSFASSGTPGVIGGATTAKPAKPFGAPPDEADADEGSAGEDEEAANDQKAAEDDEKDDRFYAQESKYISQPLQISTQYLPTTVETGEENETTEYTCRAKLYNFTKTEDGAKKEWKERGLGVVRLNVAKPDPESEDTAPKARLLMRADGSHRVALNTPVVKGVNFGSVTGEPPVGGYIYFMGSIDGSAKLELLQMKVIYYASTYTTSIC